jgi:hypothetical protein
VRRELTLTRSAFLSCGGSGSWNAVAVKRQAEELVVELEVEFEMGLEVELKVELKVELEELHLTSLIDPKASFLLLLLW